MPRRVSEVLLTSANGSLRVPALPLPAASFPMRGVCSPRIPHGFAMVSEGARGAMARDSIAAGRLDGTLSGAAVSAGGGRVAHGHEVWIEVDHRPQPLLFPDHTPP